MASLSAGTIIALTWTDVAAFEEPDRQKVQPGYEATGETHDGDTLYMLVVRREKKRAFMLATYNRKATRRIADRLFKSNTGRALR